MRFQSKTGEISETQYAPIRLPSDFPVSGVDVNIRGEIPPIPPHIHDCFELGYCYSGEGLFLVEDKILPFRAGDAAIINHREVHVMVSSPGGKTNWSFLNLDPAALLAGYVTEREERLETASFCGNRFPNVISEAEYPELVQPVREIIETRVREPAGFSSEIRSLVWLLLVRLHRAFHFETQSSPPAGSFATDARAAPYRPPYRPPGGNPAPRGALQHQRIQLPQALSPLLRLRPQSLSRPDAAEKRGGDARNRFTAGSEDRAALRLPVAVEFQPPVSRLLRSFSLRFPRCP